MWPICAESAVKHRMINKSISLFLDAGPFCFRFFRAVACYKPTSTEAKQRGCVSGVVSRVCVCVWPGEINSPGVSEYK